MSEFALMNLLIKGKAVDIQTALSKLDQNTYELNEFTYKSDNVNIHDNTIVKLGLIFNNFYENFITPEEIPFANMPELKFIGLGNGRDGNRVDGSYVFYKDFKETTVSTCYQFSYISPQREEFDGQDDILNNVHHSFMDHVWQYRFMNYSSGEYEPWAFNSKKDKALILKWKSDEVDDSNEETDVVIGGMDDVPFSYKTIDGVSPSFYEGIHNKKDFVLEKDDTINVEVDGKEYTLVMKTSRKMKSLLKTFNNSLLKKSIGRTLYDPFDVVEDKYEICGSNEYGQDVYNVLDHANKLVNVQIAHRACLFAKIHNLLKDEKVAAQIVKAAPKKKNGTLALKRVTQIASLFCMEEDTSMYVLCAVAKKDTEMLIEIRQIATVDLDKTNTDVISGSNLFRL